jgi:hypothetical protein
MRRDKEINIIVEALLQNADVMYGLGMKCDEKWYSEYQKLKVRKILSKAINEAIDKKESEGKSKG